MPNKPEYVQPFLVGGTIIIPPGLREGYTYDVPGGGQVRWCVTSARALIEANPAANVFRVEEIPLSEMAEIAKRTSWDPARLDEVDPSIPGIAAPIVLPEYGVVYILIDGLHRNARALRDGHTFHARLLTDGVARQCLLEGALELMPWGQR